VYTVYGGGLIPLIPPRKYATGLRSAEMPNAADDDIADTRVSGTSRYSFFSFDIIGQDCRCNFAVQLVVTAAIATRYGYRDHGIHSCYIDFEGVHNFPENKRTEVKVNLTERKKDGK